MLPPLFIPKKWTDWSENGAKGSADFDLYLYTFTPPPMDTVVCVVFAGDVELADTIDGIQLQI